MEVVSSDFPKSVECEIREGVKIHRFATTARLLNNPICPGLLHFLLKHSRDFDIIHAHNEHAMSSLFCGLVRKSATFPLILTHHGQLKFASPLKDVIERAYSRSIGSGILRRADRIVTLSNSERLYVHSLGVPLNRITVIPNGVELSRYDLQMNFSDPQNIVGKRVVLFVGPLIRRKGPHVLVRAIPLILEKNPDVVVIFVGEGDARKEAETLCRSLHVEDRVLFAGRVSDEWLLYLYRRSDVFVLPSFSEGFPYAIMDALAFSKPVVSTKIPSIAESLNDAALLVSPGNHKELAEAIVTLLNNAELAKEIGAKGRALLEKRYRLQHSVQKVLDIYGEVMCRR